MKILLVASHGGHMTELLQIVDAFTDHEIAIATYTSIRDIDLELIAAAYFTNNPGPKLLDILNLFPWSYAVLRKEKPDVIISFGSEIAIPYLVFSRFCRTKSVFIESWCRVKTLSVTGKLAYYLANEFWVQWPQLLDKIGKKGKYKGSVI